MSQSEIHSTDSASSGQAKICQNCKQNFVIEPEDFDFYKKIDVPPPTWCPECRNIRRLTWREERTLYKSKCDLCGKTTISIHSLGKFFTVYCRECWHSDKWDSMSYGRNYDFSQPFFTQYRKLMESVPRPALTGSNLVNSDYTHASLNCKNCYHVFWTYFSENSQYSFGLFLSKDVYDSYTTDKSDHAYETLHCNRLYKTKFVYFSDDCLDSSFLFNCLGCSNCFGCINLRKKKYCIFNQQFSKEEYEKHLTYWDLGSYQRFQEAKEKFKEFYLSFPHKYAHILNSTNVTGDIIRDTKNCQNCFSALDDVQNCKYLYFGGLKLKDSYDVNVGGDLSELLYETIALTRGSRNMFSAGGSNSKDVRYSDWTYNCSDIFGCIAIKNKKYCILNKQYSKEEYRVLIPKIVEHMNNMPYMDKKGRIYKYGEFFPTETSAYAYNESLAFTWYPKTREEVLNEGWRWQEPKERNYKITVKSQDLPDHIKDIDNSILKETIGCLHEGKCNEQCTTAFRVTREELNFYKKMNLALPRLCPNCRYAQRLNWRNGVKLWHRKCQCGGECSQPMTNNSRQYQNTAKHFHGDSPCPNEFETTFSPDKPEIIYCGGCYKDEFL
ncbi:MAG: hypothetical protein UV58_C0011G0021 [Candidatus Wolfebacteria bacterium GW2011_GWC1_43_10]|uniref:Zinc-binding domain-containing protein n=1 Tax=Candidatus Wolfebacteria bacterium GW2011_GWC1_43_10 TaxID=1619011 RepID=A0A0G1C9P0_9BACT|nr:MAG: hypothetical protein UV58_C0011G0021 [Candidatus Wolfebacteria bacterium GW2011_GWC1_43_10]KKT22582.1 MAG: hypothetical protein UW08_C0006G0022 [Parcubacteria group bacterium GW2011_GWB1_43_8b]